MEEEVGKKLQKDEDNSSPNSVLYYGREYIMEETKKLYSQALDLLSQLGITHPPLLEIMKKMVFRNK